MEEKNTIEKGHHCIFLFFVHMGNNEEQEVSKAAYLMLFPVSPDANTAPQFNWWPSDGDTHRCFSWMWSLETHPSIPESHFFFSFFFFEGGYRAAHPRKEKPARAAAVWLNTNGLDLVHASQVLTW